MAYDEVNKKTVYLCTGQPLPDDITQIVEWMLNDNFSTAYKSKPFKTINE
jgi:replication factor C subunit 3/5